MQKPNGKRRNETTRNNDDKKQRQRVGRKQQQKKEEDKEQTKKGVRGRRSSFVGHRVSPVVSTFFSVARCNGQRTWNHLDGAHTNQHPRPLPLPLPKEKGVETEKEGKNDDIVSDDNDTDRETLLELKRERVNRVGTRARKRRRKDAKGEDQWRGIGKRVVGRGSRESGVGVVSTAPHCRALSPPFRLPPPLHLWNRAPYSLGWEPWRNILAISLFLCL